MSYGADCEKTQAPPPGLGLGDVRELREARLKQHYDQCNEPVRPMSSAEILAELFSYHPPTPEALPKYAAINQAAKNFAEVILQNCPPSADRSDAIRKIREARMTANASVTLNGLSL
jgi:hypothetical protein